MDGHGNRRAKSPATLILLGLLVSGCGPQADPDELFKRALAAYERNETKAAVVDLKSILAQNPEFASARELMAKIYVDEGNGSAAQIELEKAESLGTPHANLVRPWMEALLLQKKYGEAVTLADEFIETTKSTVSSGAVERSFVVASRGIAYLALAQPDEAAESFEEAITGDPACGLAWVGKSQLALKQNSRDEARQLAAKAVAVAPELAPAWSIHGDMLFAEKNYKEAEAAYSQAIKLRAMNADDLVARAVTRLAQGKVADAKADVATLSARGFRVPHAAFAEGLVLIEEKRPGDAAEKFQLVVSRFPNYAKAACYLGLSKAAAGQTNQATSSLVGCLKVYPNADSIRRTLSATYAHVGDFTQAEKVLAPLLSRSPPDTLGSELFAEIKLLSGNPTAAVDALAKTISSETAAGRSYLNLGIALSASGDFEASTEAFRNAAAVEPELGDPRLLEALTLIQSKRNEDAKQILSELLLENPDDVQSMNLLSIARSNSGDVTGAIEILRRAVELKPSYVIGRVNLATNLARAGRHEEGLKQIEEALKLDAQNVSALELAVALDVQLGNEDRAAARISAARSTAPDDPDIGLLAARYERDVGNIKAAEQAYRQLLERGVQSSVVQRELAKVYMSVGQHPKAADLLKELVKQRDRVASDHMLLAVTYEKLGDLSGARSQVDAALLLSPRYGAAHAADIRLLIQEGNYKLARDHLRDLKEFAPDEPIAGMHMLEGQVLFAEGRTHEAIEHFRKAFELERTSGRLLDLARFLAASGDGNKAISELETWLDSNPDDEDVLFVLADAYEKTGNAEKAIRGYETLLNTQPNNFLALNNLAWLLKGYDLPRALTLAKQAAELQPDAPGILDTLAVLSLADGDLKTGLELSRKAHALLPKNAALRVHLVKALLANSLIEEARKESRGIDAKQLNEPTLSEFNALASELGL